MASSLALAACGDGAQDAADSLDTQTVVQQVIIPDDSQGATSDRRIIVYLTGDQSLYAVQNGETTLVSKRSGAPSVSPDGREVVYAKLPDSWRAGDAVRNTELHVYNVRNGKDEKLTSGHDDSDPTWAPDGKYVLFQSQRRTGVASFWKVKANGKDLEQVTNVSCSRDSDRAYVPAALTGSPVQWAPADRRIIVYFTSQTSDSEVRVIEFDKGYDVASAYSLGKGFSPAWTDDGTVRFKRQVGARVVDVEVGL
ncbi:hypothetical protein LZ198_32415 [Myxococcus sp. K15C18031901]|uniref:TolB family protein n=1 Tax=Myxococcus dinghuensis TaxID=2906761 RepID=UPI0020A78EB7|nr:hypothetical protein [Myxococcus dinghuensis]MCP3103598.1 hypothetical protein [Myxococcus dinghuensis]